MFSARLIARATVLAAVLVAGCTTMRREVIVSAHHPASPDAPEAPLPPESTTLVVAPATSPGADTVMPVQGHHKHPSAVSATPVPPSDLR
jgi:hypothetical protein